MSFDVPAPTDNDMDGPDGYDKLATLFSTYPELAIVRKFGALSMKCLLYRQAELTYLEHELEQQSQWDRRNPEKSKLTRSWYEFTHAEADLDLEHHRKKVNELQDKIQQYHSTLIQATEVLQLLNGQGASLQTLKKWLALPEGGDNFLKVIEFGPWSGFHDDDMVALLPASSTDTFGQRLGDRFSPLYHDLIGSRQPPSGDLNLGPIWKYDREAFTFAGNVLCMLFSFAMPTASIFALYYVHAMLARLLMVAGFIFIFAFAMMFAVGVRRGEVFAATAAFAAIQVVFVGGVNVFQIGAHS